MYLETDIEKRLKQRLEDYGFMVLKLTTPGRIGVMDRIILRPKYSPGPPMFVELKRDKKKLRLIQQVIADDWAARGCIILPPCIGMEAVEKLCDKLIREVAADYAFFS
jgi:hypothetical protein